MRKTFFAVLAAALTVLGCHKGPQVPVDHLDFTSESPETRTGWTGQTLEWTAGDAISMAYSVSGDWVGPNLYPSKPLAEGGPTAHFTVPGNFPTDLVGQHRFYAVYPAVAGTDFSDAPDVHTAVPEIQTPTADSFDPAADLMAGESVNSYRSFPSGSVPLRWTRLVAHGDITLKGLPLEQGETVQNIVLQAQSGADLTGDVVIDLGCPEDFATDGTPRLTVKADNLSVDADGNLRFWISLFPTTLTELTVTVDTDKATYVKTFPNISKVFTQNARNILGVNMADAVKTVNEQNYEKVTIAPADWTGDYLIVYEPESILLDGDGTKSSHASVTINDDVISYETYKAYNIRIEKAGSGYSMRFGDQYFGLKSDDNALHLGPSNTAKGFQWTFSVCDGDTEATNVQYPSRTLRYNASAHYFRCYKSGQQPVQFYRLGGAGGGGQQSEPTVTTVGALDVTKTEATLSATYTGTPSYGGFEWGSSANDLSEDWQASYLTNGSFQVKIDGLGAGHTYYYRAYIAVLEDGTYKYYYGEVKSFTTPAGEIVIDSNPPTWCEMPVVNMKKSGNYRIDKNDPTQYYAFHMCSGGEKGPDGKTARSYTVCFSAEHHCPVWVAAPRHSMYVGNSGRNDSYRADPDIPSDIQYNSKSTGGGCNKGHMLGSAERTSTKATNRDVFYYTNIAPQLSAGFNTGGGGWNTLEDYVDTKVCADTLYEVIGCYFDKYTDAYGWTVTPSTISFGGRNDVSKPTMFYYVLLRTKKGNTGKSLKDCSADEMMCVAFVRAHTNSLKGQAVTARELMSVADLEKITGVTYFPNVPNAPKKTFKASDWGL